jgi:PAS domain S-box-containing protein
MKDSLTELRSSELAPYWLSAIIESAEDAIITKTLDGVITSWNKGAERIFGYTAEEVIGKPVSVLIPPDHSDEEPRILARLRQGERIEHYETLRTRKDGTLVDISLTVSPIRGPEGRIIGASKIARDITARKRAEGSLARSEERLALAQGAGNIGTFDWDIRTDSVEWTQELESLFGLPPGGFGGTFKNWRERVHPADLTTCEATIKEAIQGKAPDWQLEYRISRADTGEMRWIDARSRIFYDDAGEPLRMIGINIDVTGHKRAEQSLRKQQEDYQTILDSVPAMIWYKDKENRHLRCNRRAAEFIGLSVGEVEGTSAWELFPREDAERFYAEDLEVINSGRPKVGLVELLNTPSGDHLWHQTDKIPYFDQDGKISGVVIVSSDITPQKLSQSRLATQYSVTKILAVAATLEEATPKLIRSICESLGWDLGELWRVCADEECLRCSGGWHSPSVAEDVYADMCNSNALRRGVGLPGRVWSCGESVWISDVTKDEDFPRAKVASRGGLRSAFAFPIRAGQETAGVMEFFSREVREYQVEVIEMISTLGSQIGQFIERKEAEEALRESEESFRTLAQTASDAIITIDEASTILFANPAVEKVFGYTAHELRGRQITLLMPDYLRRLHHAGLKRYQETGRRHISWEGVELPGLRKGGEEVPLEISFGEFEKNGRHYFTGIVRDVSDRKRAEEERERSLASEKQAREEAEEANRLKDEFLATLSHELRTPLTSILGWSRLLQTNNFDEAAATRAIQTIQRNALAQRQLIDDLLDTSRIITGKLRLDVRAVDPGGVVTAAADAVRPAADAKNIRLQTLLDPQAGPISGDPDRLQQVVWNLLSNAVKFTPKGGRVQVRLERVNSHVEITVADTGKGIVPEFLPHVFDRFRQADQTTTRTHGGLGLGLAIVRQLVELHGGTVHVGSEGEGQGTTFTVSLPLLPIRKEPMSEAPRVHPAAKTDITLDCPPELEGLRVLVVDDEPDTRELLQMVLTSCGAQAVLAASAAEALEEIGRGQFDVLISDIGMPEDDGYSLMAKIRRLPADRGGRMPAAALTAYARAEDRVRALRCGFQTHVSKPVEPSELIAVVANLAGRTYTA